MKIFAQIISAFVALVFCALFGVIVWYDYGLWVIAVCAAMILNLPLASLFHELGHVVFGRICKIKAVPSLKLLGSSSCKIIPLTDKNLKARLFFTVKGGLYFNALAAIVFYMLCIYGVLPSFMYFIVTAHIYLYILNGFPIEYASGKSDGAVSWGLVTGVDSEKVMLSVLTVQAQVLCGKPIAEVDESLLFDVPQLAEDDINFISLTELRYEYFKAKGDTEKADFYKKRLDEIKIYL